MKEPWLCAGTMNHDQASCIHMGEVSILGV